MQETPYLTLGQVAEHFGVQTWRLNRLFRRGKLPEAARVGTARVVTRGDLPAIERALKEAGYLKE